MSARPTLLEAQDIHKTFGHIVALEGVDIALLEGETHGLVGDNGAGKSTLIKILSGALQPTSGTLVMDGREAAFESPLDGILNGIATVHQNLALVESLSIAGNLYLGREPTTRTGFIKHKQMRNESQRLVESLDQMNIDNSAALVRNLSGGQRQAVAIARGIDLASRLLILDEPMAALGVRETAKVLQLLQSLRGRRQTMLIISHNLSHVLALADRITVLRAGRLVMCEARENCTQDSLVRAITGI